MEATASTSQPAPPENSDREFISLLIDLYRDCPELWKVKSKDYFNRNKKSAALEKIVVALRKLKPDFTVKQLKQKINVLRTNFNREFKAIESKKISGTSTDDIPEPSLWYFNDMYFIKDQLEIAQTDTSEQPSIPDEDSQSQVNSESVESPPKRAITGKKRKGVPDITDQLVGLATEYFKRPETEEDIIARGWAMKLKKLAADQRRFAEKIINDALFEAEMGTLTREGVRCIFR